MTMMKKGKAQIVRNMADYMLANSDNCTRDTLLLQFTGEEIDTCHEEARALANADAGRKKAA